MIRKTILIIGILLSLDAWAVGLGKMRVQSALDQPLNAEIELLSTTPAELSTLTVTLGTRSDFRRANVDRSTVLSLINFEPSVRDSGEPYVRLTSLEPITEPFLHFLISLEWAGGKLIREYTALLDPPLYAQGRPASVSSPRLSGQSRSGSSVQQVSRASASVSRQAAVTRPANAGEVYGPIQRGETVSGIVGRLNLSTGVDIFQAMIALLQKNPDAFIRGNINLLKEGLTLVMPTNAEIASISKIAASVEFSQQLDEWFAYRNQVAGGQLASSVPQKTALDEATSTSATSTDGSVTDSAGISQDVLRIIQSDDELGSANGEELTALRSQLVVMEESLLSTELENNELKERLSLLEDQIKETNKLLKLNNSGLALAENNASESSSASQAGTSEEAAAGGGAAEPSNRVRRASSGNMFDSLLRDLTRGDMLWKVILGLALLILLIGAIVYNRRRKSYAEFEETMMTGSTYDLRSQSSTYTQMPNMDTAQNSQPSHLDSHSQQTGSLMQTSFMTEMGAPGMGTMQSDEVDPIAEAEVYMAYGRDQQAMEVLQEAIRRDPGRSELKIKLLEVYQKRKDVRSFESLAEELFAIIGKDADKWSRVADMGRRVSPKHPLFSTASGLTSNIGSTRSGGSIDRDSSGLDLISAPFSRSVTTSASSRRPAVAASAGGSINFDLGDDGGLGGNAFADLDSESVTMPLGGGLNVPSTPANMGFSGGGADDSGLLVDTIDDVKDSEIATKLDLAKAYMEMGDRDAARGFLDEVLKEGNESQRKQASELAGNF